MTTSNKFSLCLSIVALVVALASPPITRTALRYRHQQREEKIIRDIEKFDDEFCRNLLPAQREGCDAKTRARIAQLRAENP